MGNKQKRLRDAALMAAEAEKIKIVKQAEAAADAQHLQGQGIARQRAAIIEGLKDSITSGTGETLSSEKVSELLLVRQCLFLAVQVVFQISRAKSGMEYCRQRQR